MPEGSNTLNLDNNNFPKGRYEPLEMLGKGALGEVFLARDTTLKRTVAVKRLIRITDDQVVLFHREARIASKLSHPNIITILDFGTTESGRPYMALEHFDGISLERLIDQQGRLPEALVVKIFVTIAEALDYIHQHKIFHRDLKPSNVLLNLDEQGDLVDLRVIDFGLSCIKEEVQNYALKQGLSLVGTPLYMSPDPVAGLEFDARSEVYSMGCLMYEALTGGPPFDGEAAMDLLEQHAHSEPVPLRELVPGNDISISMQNVVLKCLAKSPSDRYQSMQEFIDAIEQRQNASSTDLASIGAPVKTKASWTRVVLAAVVIFLVGMVVSVAMTLTGGTEREVDVKNDGAFPRMAPQEFGTGEVPDIDAGERGMYFWGDESFERLEALAKSGKKREIITLRGMQIGKKEIDCINTLTPKLLRIQHCQLSSDEDLSQLAANGALCDLVCHDCNNITPRSLSLLRSAPNLSSLVLENCGITDAHLEALRTVPQLRKLALERNLEITSSGVRQLGKRGHPLAVWLSQNLFSNQEIADLKSNDNIVVLTKESQSVEDGLIRDPSPEGRL